VIAGLLWNAAGSYAPFILGAGLSFLAALMLAALLGNTKSKRLI
jgi:hypothetical protein